MHSRYEGTACKYLTSPSLPSDVQQYQQQGSHANAKLSGVYRSAPAAAQPLPRLDGTYTSLMQSTLQRDSSAAKEDFSATLSRIGPSARRLLALDAEEKEGKTDINGNGNTGTIGSSTSRRAHAATDTSALKSSAYGAAESSKTRSLDPPSASFRHRQMPLGQTVDQKGSTFGASGKSSKALGGSLGGVRDPGNQTSYLAGTFTKQKMGTLGNTNLGSTFTGTARSKDPPPLVTHLRAFLSREIQMTQDGSDAPSPLDQLGPYREAFGALIDAFPNYESILSSIRSAYDNVILCQAELLTEAYSREVSEANSARQHSEDVDLLSRQITHLKSSLETMKQDVERRDREATQIKEQNRSIDDMRHDNMNLKMQLERTKAQLEELEASSKGDLEKILILISSVRECDRRLKDYEQSISRMSTQVQELDEFKRLASESQTELQKFKEKFEAFVPNADFEAMKEYLTEELNTSQALARRMRRTAAVRGTQVDVLNRRVQQLEQERDALTSAADPQKLLTPRPNWDRLAVQVPELSDEARSVHSLTLKQTDGDAAEDTDEAQVLVVKGPDTTVLRVEFLADRVEALKKQLERAEREKTEALRIVGSRSGAPDSGRERPNSGTSSSSFRPGALTSRGSFIKRKSLTDAGTSPALSRPVVVPLFGPGIGASVPAYLRCCGFVERIPVQTSLATTLIYRFFLNELGEVVDNDTGTDEPSDLAPIFRKFLEKRMVDMSDDLGEYPLFSHLALNLLEDAQTPHLTSPALRLLVSVLHGSIPPRIAFDAATGTAHVVSDLEALAKEQQKSRLRRQAISECIIPVLELRTREELQDLKSTLGTESSFDVYTLTKMENRFMSTLFFQECQASSGLFGRIIKSLTEKSYRCPENHCDRIVFITDVIDTIQKAEPLTPAIVIRELAESTVKREHNKDPDAAEDSAPADPVDYRNKRVLLSDAIRAISLAPVIPRTALSTREECML